MSFGAIYGPLVTHFDLVFILYVIWSTLKDPVILTFIYTTPEKKNMPRIEILSVAIVWLHVIWTHGWLLRLNIKPASFHPIFVSDRMTEIKRES